MTGTGRAWRERYDDALAHGATMSEAIHAANNPHFRAVPGRVGVWSRPAKPSPWDVAFVAALTRTVLG